MGLLYTGLGLLYPDCYTHAFTVCKFALDIRVMRILSVNICYSSLLSENVLATKVLIGSAVAIGVTLITMVGLGFWILWRNRKKIREKPFKSWNERSPQNADQCLDDPVLDQTQIKKKRQKINDETRKETRKVR